MVSVNYGQGQSGTQAYLPYTVARDGAFRPPVLYGVTGLLPMSRLPRILTNVCTTPYQPIFTKRIRGCGTVDQTREVKSDMIRTSCEAQKAIQTDPDLNEPVTALQIRDDVVYHNVKTQPSCPANAEEIRQRLHQPPIHLTSNIPSYSMATQPNCPANAEEIKQRLHQSPIHLTSNIPSYSVATNNSAVVKTSRDFLEKYDNVVLPSNKPATEAYTNSSAAKESPVVFSNIQLNPARPYTTATTSAMAPGTGFIHPAEYNRLQSRPAVGGFDGYKQIPKMVDNPVKRLTRQRAG